MKTKGIVLTVLMLLIAAKVNGQVTQLELASGAAKSNFSIFSVRSIAAEDRWFITTLSFYQGFHRAESKAFNVVGFQPTLFRRVNASISIGTGFYYNTVVGFSQRVSLLYQYRKAGFSLTASPVMYYNHDSKKAGAEVMLLMEYTTPISCGLAFYLRAQLLSSWNRLTHHARSFQQLRLGLSHKRMKFGLFLDLDQYGGRFISRRSAGLFIRKEI